MNKLPLPPTEILRTWADIDTSTKVLNFKPTTTLEDGVKKFIAWYRGYRHQRQDEKTARKPSISEKWFAKLLEDSFARGKKYKEDSIKNHNDEIERRMQHEREKYLKWAQSHDRKTPEINKLPFSFHEGVDSPGGDIPFIGHIKGAFNELQQRCLDIPQCIAFNSNGVLKQRVSLIQQWTKGAFPKGKGLYIANVDMCKADLHDCHRHASCITLNNARFECRCKQGYIGTGATCLPVLGQVPEEEMKRDYLENTFSLYDITKMKEGKEFVFFKGLDSPGGDYMLISKHQRDPQQLQDICKKDKICIGVNTNGFMKKRIQTKNKWTKWSLNEDDGLYVMDINYCVLDDVACPDHAECERVGPGDSKCMCHPSYIMKNENCIKPPPISPELQPKPDLQNVENNIQDVDMCKTGSHNCHKYASCIPIKNSKFECQCEKGYIGDGITCLPILGQVAEEEMKEVYEANMFKSYNITEMKKGKDFVFFKGLDSPGGDYMVISMDQTDPQQLQDICRKDKICIGVNTKGEMKKRIQTKYKWTKWSIMNDQGLYVIDMNYCLLDDVPCPDHAECGKVGPADWKCVCKPPYNMKNGLCVTPAPVSQKPEAQNLANDTQKTHVNLNQKHKSLLQGTAHANSEESLQKNINVESNDDVVHIAFSVDKKYVKIVPVVINSVLLHITIPVKFHVLLIQCNTSELLRHLECFPQFHNISLEVKEFDLELLTPVMKTYMQKLSGNDYMGYLSSLGNYARFYFHRIFPDLSHVIYLDVDLVVLKDISDMWRAVQSHTTVITAAIRRPGQFGFYQELKVKKMYKERYNKDLDTRKFSFNAGVFGANLDKWRSESKKIEEELAFWMKKNIEMQLWPGGTQPLMLLVFWEDKTLIDGKWNVAGVNWMTFPVDLVKDQSAIIHWSGIDKPWGKDLSVVKYQELWQQYVPVSSRPDDPLCSIP